MHFVFPRAPRGRNVAPVAPNPAIGELLGVVDSSGSSVASGSNLSISESLSVLDSWTGSGGVGGADFAARSTAPGVVWAHDFTNAAEISAFTGSYPADYTSVGPPLKPVQVADAVTGTAMRTYALGAVLAANFPASGGVGPRPLVISDATYWPDPAISGNYVVMLVKQPPDHLNDVLLVTARSGTTLTVTYQAYGGGPVSLTQRDWIVGDHIGGQTKDTWYRDFSALKGDSNGKGVNDINRPGKTLRSHNDLVNFPYGSGIFGYGWYGRPEYQTTFQNWNPSTYGGDNNVRANCWDGSEFYLQWRQKVDPRFLSLNQVAYNDPNGVYYGRKVWMLQSQVTCPQQITGGYSPGATFYEIPSTPEPPFKIAGYSPQSGSLAGRTLTQNLDGTGSYQTGSAYAATAIYGTSNMNPGDAWEVPSGQWVTFMLHVIPGLHWDYGSNPTASGVRNTTIEMWGAKETDSAFTLLFSSSAQATVYGSSGPTENTWFSALPGYNAIGLTSYLNTDLGSPPPTAAYTIDFSQVIFSTSPIACPAPVTTPTFPFTMPASGHIGTISTNTLSSLTASDANEQFSMLKVLSAWGTSGVSLTKTGVAVTDIVYPIFGGGHGDTGNDGVYGWRASTGAFERILAPSAQCVAKAFAATATIDVTHGEDVANRPDSQHCNQDFCSLDSDEPNGPAYMQLYGFAIGQGAIDSGQAHRFDHISKTWSRFGDVGTINGTVRAQALVKDTSRKLFIRYPSDNGTTYYTLDYSQTSPTWQTHTQGSRINNWSSTAGFEACGTYDPVRDIDIVGNQQGAGSNFCAIRSSNRGGSWTALTFTGAGPTMGGVAPVYVKNGDYYAFLDTSTVPPTGIFVLTPPAVYLDPLTNPWTWSRRSFIGTSTYSNYAANNGEYFNRVQYVESLHALIFCPSPTGQMEAWKL